MKIKRRVLEDAALTRSSSDCDFYLSIARGLSWVLNDNFTERALQDAGQTIDNPQPLSHPMPLDSEGQRGLKASQKATN